MSYWRQAGLTYLQFSRIAASVVRNGVKKEVKADPMRATSTIKISKSAKE